MPSLLCTARTGVFRKHELHLGSACHRLGFWVSKYGLRHPVPFAETSTARESSTQRKMNGSLPLNFRGALICNVHQTIDLSASGFVRWCPPFRQCAARRSLSFSNRSINILWLLPRAFLSVVCLVCALFS